MNRPAIAAMGLAGLLLVSCGEDGSAQRSRWTGIEQFGLVASPADYPLVLSAVASANAVLPSGGRKFAPGWVLAGELAAVPVYAVRGGLGSREIMATFPECQCVVVQAGALNAWLEAKVGSGSALLTVEPPLILSYMLLHEAGHIVRDASIVEVPSSGTPEPSAALDRDLNLQKQREADADGFAAEAMRSGLQEGRDRGIAAGGIAMGLSQLSWNLTAHRLLDNFGGTTLRKPALFWDAGTSHPNLEWRILVVNNLIAGTEASRQLLEEFEKARETGPDTILWQRAK